MRVLLPSPACICPWATPAAQYPSQAKAKQLFASLDKAGRGGLDYPDLAAFLKEVRPLSQ